MGWGDYVQGGLEGAGGGALGGSAFGPVGTGIGAGLGFLGGIFGAYQKGHGPSGQYQSFIDGIRGRQAPQAGPAAQAGYGGFRQGQQQLIDELLAQSRGQGPSLAGQQLLAGQDRGMRQAQGLAAGTSGPNAALAQFQAANVAGANQAQTNQDAASARIQEIYNAQQLAGLNLQGARESDQSVNMFNAGQQNDMSQANLAAKLKAMGLNDDAVLQALAGLSGNQNQPTLGDQILSGGAGLAAWKASQGGAGGGGGQPGVQTSGGSVPWGQAFGQGTQPNPWGVSNWGQQLQPGG